MLNWIIFSTIASLGASTIYAWLRGRRPNASEIEVVKKKATEHLALNQWDLAYQSLAPLVQHGIADPTLAITYVRALSGRRQLTQALTFLDNILQIYPEELGLFREKGRVLLDLGHYPAALRCLQQAKAVLRSEDDHLDLAIALFETGQVEEAWDLVGEPAIESVNGRVLALAGDCAFFWQRYEDASTYYERARQFGWCNHGLLSKLAHCLRKLEEYSQAQRYYREILSRDSGDIGATLGLGCCFERQQRYDRALIIYQSGKAWDHSDPRILARAGICAARTQQHRYAELYLTEAIKQGQESPEVLAHLGYSMECQRRWTEAEQVYFRIVENYPQHVSGYRALAWIYGIGLSKQIDREAGLTMAHKALQLLPDADSWELLSACEARAGNFDKAHDIQEQLSSRSSDRDTRRRRQEAMRTLRRRQPLNESHVGRCLVA